MRSAVAFEIGIQAQRGFLSMLKKVYGIDVKAKMNAIPADYVTKLKANYRASEASPSNTQYGWIRG